MYDKNLIIIKEILCEVLQMDKQELNSYNIDENTCLIYELGEQGLPLSSYDYVSFITELEREFNILYDFEKPIETIGDAIELIAKSKKWEGEYERFDSK